MTCFVRVFRVIDDLELWSMRDKPL
jgi:hypothetical protein